MSLIELQRTKSDIYYLKETRCTFCGKKRCCLNTTGEQGWIPVWALGSNTFSLQTSFPGSNSTIASPLFSLGKHLTVNMNEPQQKVDSYHVKIHCISFHSLSVPPRSCWTRPSGLSQKSETSTRGPSPKTMLREQHVMGGGVEREE